MSFSEAINKLSSESLTNLAWHVENENLAEDESAGLIKAINTEITHRMVITNTETGSLKIQGASRELPSFVTSNELLDISFEDFKNRS